MSNKTEIRITVEEGANGCAVRVDMDGSAKGIMNGLGAAVNDFCESENIPLPVFFYGLHGGESTRPEEKRCFHPCAKFERG